jgi:hypothetical protein
MTAKASVYDLAGDLVIYRNLDAAEPRLPRFVDAWDQMGLPGPARPRKLDPAYSQALAWILRRARALDAPGTELAELVYLGDTALNDGNAFRNVRAASGWRGWAFIGAERDEELAVSEKDGVFVANRWSALSEFVSWLRSSQAAALDARTAVIVDVDKTALGARGRNDNAIDRARVVALEATVAGALGAIFDPGTFRRAYAELNAPRYHTFTMDNQDNLAYVCMMVGANLWTLDDLLADLAARRLVTVQDLMERVQAQRDRLPGPALLALHDDIYARASDGDPTPFKAFRQREYLETVKRLGQLPDSAPFGQRLVEEICMTREVLDVVRWFRARGCLLLAVSDKPDEAAFPTAELAREGYLPLHCIPTHIAGQSIAALLPEGS